jgi:hypothetical protein
MNPINQSNSAKKNNNTVNVATNAAAKTVRNHMLWFFCFNIQKNGGNSNIKKIRNKTGCGIGNLRTTLKGRCTFAGPVNNNVKKTSPTPTIQAAIAAKIAAQYKCFLNNSTVASS